MQCPDHAHGDAYPLSGFDLSQFRSELSRSPRTIKAQGICRAESQTRDLQMLCLVSFVAKVPQSEVQLNWQSQTDRVATRACWRSARHYRTTFSGWR